MVLTIQIQLIISIFILNIHKDSIVSLNKPYILSRDYNFIRECFYYLNLLTNSFNTVNSDLIQRKYFNNYKTKNVNTNNCLNSLKTVDKLKEDIFYGIGKVPTLYKNNLLFKELARSSFCGSYRIEIWRNSLFVKYLINPSELKDNSQSLRKLTKKLRGYFLAYKFGFLNNLFIYNHILIIPFNPYITTLSKCNLTNEEILEHLDDLWTRFSNNSFYLADVTPDNILWDRRSNCFKVYDWDIYTRSYADSIDSLYDLISDLNLAI